MMVLLLLMMMMVVVVVSRHSPGENQNFSQQQKNIGYKQLKKCHTAHEQPDVVVDTFPYSVRFDSSAALYRTSCGRRTDFQHQEMAIHACFRDISVRIYHFFRFTTKLLIAE